MRVVVVLILLLECSIVWASPYVANVAAKFSIGGFCPPSMARATILSNDILVYACQPMIDDWYTVRVSRNLS